MRARSLLVVGLVALLAGALAVPALAHDEGMGLAPTVVAYKASSAPVIDGKLDDAAWLDAALAGAKVSGFVTHVGDAIATDQTIAYITWDDENLYVAFKNYRTDMNQLVANMTEPMSSVFLEDDNEVFIDPFHDHATFIQFAWNAIATKWSGIGDVESWQVATSKDDTAWYAEVAIPWTLVGVTPAEGLTIGFNVTSHVIWNDQWTTWSPTFGTFLNPRRFGHLQLAGQYVRP